MALRARMNVVADRADRQNFGVLGFKGFARSCERIVRSLSQMADFLILFA
jgi:hypothetical protein